MQPWRVTEWPTVTWSARTVGCWAVTWSTQLSWTFVRAPEPDRVHVAPDHGVHPDARVVAQLDAADHLGGRVHVDALAQLRAVSPCRRGSSVHPENRQFSRGAAERRAPRASARSAANLTTCSRMRVSMGPWRRAHAPGLPARRASRAGAALAASPLLAAAAQAAPARPRATSGASTPTSSGTSSSSTTPGTAAPPITSTGTTSSATRRSTSRRATCRSSGPTTCARSPSSSSTRAGSARPGVGAVALSWWGRGSWQDRAVPLILDVLRAHDLKATFALEPYADDRARYYASDILYLLREYGEKRHWDAFLLLRNADGRVGPVFKSFRTVLPETSTDCLGEDAPGLRLHVRRRLAAADRLAARHAPRRLRPRHPARRLARVRPHPGRRASTASASTTTSSRPRATAATPRAPRARGSSSRSTSTPATTRSSRARPSDPCYAPRDFAPPTPGLDFATRRRAASARPRASAAPDPRLLGGDARGPARPGPHQRARAASSSSTSTPSTSGTRATPSSR